jgi:cytochrome P450
MDRQFHRFGDIYKSSMYGSDAYIVRNPEFAYHVLVENWQNYVKGRLIKRVALLLGDGLMASEGELWKRQRRMIQPAFHRETLGSLLKLFVSVNSALLEKWRTAAERNEGINVTRDTSRMALEVILRAVLGDDYDQAAAHFNLLTEEPARDWAFALTFRAFGKVILEVAARRRKEDSKAIDFLAMLMQARDPETGQLMEDGQLINEVLTLIVAGHETTASTLNWMWYLLSQHPEVEERLSRELGNLTSLSEIAELPKYPYARQIIEESLRLYPAGWLLTRKALQDDWLGEYFVPAGTEVYIPPYFIQRHPDLWKDPDSFIPDRFGPDKPKQHRLAMLPFSAGPRNCVGEHFARVEMQVHLLLIAKDLQLRYVQATPPELDAGVNLRSKCDFIMYPEVRRLTTKSCLLTNELSRSE